MKLLTVRLACCILALISFLISFFTDSSTRLIVALCGGICLLGAFLIQLIGNRQTKNK